MLRKALILLISLLCLTIVTACNYTAGTVESDDLSSHNTAKDNDLSDTDENFDSDSIDLNDPVELIVYSNSGDSPESFDERFGDAIRKQFPNYEITYIRKADGTRLHELIAQKVPIDLYWESVGQFVDGLIKHNMQWDMSMLIEKNNVDLNRFEPTTIEAMRQISDGNMYGLPVSNNSLSLFYNKDIFDRFGVAYPTNDITWEELLDLNKKLTVNDGDTQYVGLGMSNVHFFRLNAFSLPYVDPETETAFINSDPRWRILYQTGLIEPAEAPGFRERIEAKGLPQGESGFIKDQDVAMYLFQSSYPFTRDLSEIRWDMVPYPSFEEQPGIGAQPYPTYFSIPVTSQHKEQAMEVIKFLISEEFQMLLSRKGIMTVLNDEKIQKALGQDGPLKDKNLQSVYHNKFAPISPKTNYDSIAERIYRSKIEEMSLGKLDINTAFRQIEEEVNQEISAAKATN